MLDASESQHDDHEQFNKEKTMNTRFHLILCTLLVTLLLSACGVRVLNGSGTVVTESRPVRDFTAINFSGFGELTLVQGEDEGLTVETDDNLLAYIKTSVNRGTLTIGFDDGVWLPMIRPSDSIRYRLTVKTLDTVELSGAGRVAATALTADRLTLTESGAGEITIAGLTAEEVTVEMSGAGTVELAGAVTHQSVEMSGLGSYAASDLASETATVALSGAGEATVWVTEQLEAELSGAGSIRYYGAPQLTSDSSGLGDVQSLGAK
jgi:hypothetical protein